MGRAVSTDYGLAEGNGDAAAYSHLRDRYRDMARMLGCEGHIAWNAPPAW
jgi:hypothetical protein